MKKFLSFLVLMFVMVGTCSAQINHSLVEAMQARADAETQQGVADGVEAGVQTLNGQVQDAEMEFTELQQYEPYLSNPGGTTLPTTYTDKVDQFNEKFDLFVEKVEDGWDFYDFGTAYMDDGDMALMEMPQNIDGAYQSFTNALDAFVNAKDRWNSAATCAQTAITLAGQIKSMLEEAQQAEQATSDARAGCLQAINLNNDLLIALAGDISDAYAFKDLLQEDSQSLTLPIDMNLLNQFNAAMTSANANLADADNHWATYNNANDDYFDQYVDVCAFVTYAVVNAGDYEAVFELIKDGASFLNQPTNGTSGWPTIIGSDVDDAWSDLWTANDLLMQLQMGGMEP